MIKARNDAPENTMPFVICPTCRNNAYARKGVAEATCFLDHTFPVAGNEQPKTTSDLLRDEVEAIAAEFPDLGLSFGYIGNWERDFDGRSFRVFTNRQDEHFRSYSMHLGGADSLERALESFKAGALRAFCERAMQQQRRYY
jgi:hypothetical protein